MRGRISGPDRGPLPAFPVNQPPLIVTPDKVLYTGPCHLRLFGLCRSERSAASCMWPANASATARLLCTGVGIDPPHPGGPSLRRDRVRRGQLVRPHGSDGEVVANLIALDGSHRAAKLSLKL